MCWKSTLPWIKKGSKNPNPWNTWFCKRCFDLSNVVYNPRPLLITPFHFSLWICGSLFSTYVQHEMLKMWNWQLIQGEFVREWGSVSEPSTQPIWTPSLYPQLCLECAVSLYVGTMVIHDTVCSQCFTMGWNFIRVIGCWSPNSYIEDLTPGTQKRTILGEMSLQKSLN